MLDVASVSRYSLLSLISDTPSSLPVDSSIIHCSQHEASGLVCVSTSSPGELDGEDDVLRTALFLVEGPVPGRDDLSVMFLGLIPVPSTVSSFAHSPRPCLTLGFTSDVGVKVTTVELHVSRSFSSSTGLVVGSFVMSCANTKRLGADVYQRAHSLLYQPTTSDTLVTCDAGQSFVACLSQ